MFNFYKPHITDPTASFLAHIAGHLALGLAVYGISYGIGIAFFLDPDSGFEVAESIVGHPVTLDDALRYIENVASFNGAVAVIVPTIMLILKRMSPSDDSSS